MSTEIINAGLLARMFLAGAQNLDAKKEWINELNVFPVPDGDTGTNMTLTILSAAKDVQALPEITMPELCKAISTGSLRGARGNSGVILSQLFRGFTKAIKGVEEIDIPTLAAALTRATDTAYKAVMKPKEGTILTVAKGISIRAAEMALEEDMDMDTFLRTLIEYGDYVLSQTPELLPVLKQAGVVDSGGQGLMTVLKGAYDAYSGKEIEISIEASERPAASVQVNSSDIDTADIRYGYCTEFIIMLDKPFEDSDEEEFKAFLESIGDSIVCVSDDELVKVHVHTNDPGLAIQKALTYGPLNKMKIDNMRIEHQEKLIKDASRIAKEQEAQKKAAANKPYGFISVSVGEGLEEIFRSLGVDQMISGGQTMNPSTEDFLDAIRLVHANTIFIFPNNKNIVLAAQQAARLTEDKEIIVIPTATVPQGITALINFNPELSASENASHMQEEISHVRTGQVTYAVRNTSIDGVKICENDIMGIGDNAILAVGKSIHDTAMEMAEKMVDEDTVLISIYYGADIFEEDAQVLLKQLSDKYPSCDIDMHFGGQPVYYYIISVE